MKIEELNKLVTINLDRIEGFKKIENQVLDAPKILFLSAGKIYESELFISEIEEIFQKEGKSIERKDSLEGKLVRAWMNVLNAVSRDNDKNLLDSIIFGEDSALKVYQDLIFSIQNDEKLNHLTHILINQQNKIKDSLNDFIYLREEGYSN